MLSDKQAWEEDKVQKTLDVFGTLFNLCTLSTKHPGHFRTLLNTCFSSGFSALTTLEMFPVRQPDSFCPNLVPHFTSTTSSAILLAGELITY